MRSGAHVNVPIVVDKDRRVLIPLYVEVGQERPQIIQGLAEQAIHALTAINAYIASMAPIEPAV